MLATWEGVALCNKKHDELCGYKQKRKIRPKISLHKLALCLKTNSYFELLNSYLIHTVYRLEQIVVNKIVLYQMA